MKRARKLSPTSGDPLEASADRAERGVERLKEIGTETDFGLREALREKRQKQKASEQVDLPPEARYGKTALLPRDLKDREPQHDGGSKNLLRRVTVLETENARLRAEVERLNKRLHEVSQVEPSTNQGEVQEVVAGTRAELEDLHEVDLNGIPPFVGGRGTDPMAHLRKHYGQWLTYFGAPRNMVWLHQVRKHDKKLVRALADRLPKIEGVATLGEIIPTKMEMRDELVNDKTLEEIFKDPTLARVAYARLQGLLYG